MIKIFLTLLLFFGHVVAYGEDVEIRGMKGVNIKDAPYNATGDGIHDDTTAIQEAVDQSNLVIIPAGKYLVRGINLPNKDTQMIGFGNPTISSSGIHSLFNQVNHGVLTTFDGINFTGSKPGIEFNDKDNVHAFKEYVIRNCRFNMNSDVFGIKLKGTREGEITSCVFEGGNGIYTSHANFRIIDKCIFKSGGTAIFDDGQDSVYSTGSYITNTEIMGYSIGVKISHCEDFLISNSTIDYNDENMAIIGQEGGKIIGNYLGSGTTNPAILISGDNSVDSKQIIISENTITGHFVGPNYDCISIMNGYSYKIINNVINFYTKNGITFNHIVLSLISGNTFSPRKDFSTGNAISGTNDDSSNKIDFNDFGNPPSGLRYSQMFQNRGYSTENSGIVILEASETSKLVKHLLDYTPSISDIIISPNADIGNAKKFWFNQINPATFTVHLDAAPGAAVTFSWQAKKKNN